MTPRRGGETLTPRFAIGDRVTVKDATSIFHTRTQEFVRNRTGVVVDHRPAWVIPEDEAFDRVETGRTEPFYVVSFKQTDLWPRYTGYDIDTLETECAEGWLSAAATDEAATKEQETDT